MNIKLILFVFFVLTGMHMKGQDYIPLVVENRDWSTLYVLDCDWPDTSYHSEYIKLEGDTIIEDLHYFKVLIALNETMDDWILNGCIREDSEKKVWYKPLGKSEHLLYEFEVQTGDTIYAYEPPLIVDSIKYMYTGEILRKHIYLGREITPNYEIWIEGIGSNMGFLSAGTLGYIGGYSLLLCMHDDGQLIWQNPNYNDCWLISVIDDLKVENINVSVTINNYNDIKIENKEASEITFEIYNILGQQLISQNIFGNNESKINMNSFKNGIYIYRILLKNHKEKSQKFIKL